MVQPACAPSTPRSSSPALRVDRVLSRGALTYAVAFAGTDRLVSVELETDFQLVVRSLGGGAATRVRLGPPDWDVADLAIDERGRTAFVASSDGTVRTVDLDRARVAATWHLGDAASAVAISPDGGLLAAGGQSGLVCLRRQADGALLQCVAAHTAPVSDLSFDAAGARLASASWDGRAIVFTVPALAILAELDTGGSANQIAFAPDGARLAIAAGAAPPRWTPEAARLGSGPRDPRARLLLWRPVRGGPARVMGNHERPVTAIAWVSPTRLLSGSWDRTVRLWDTRREREIGRLSSFAHLVRGVAASGPRAAVAAWGPGDGPATALLGLGHPP